MVSSTDGGQTWTTDAVLTRLLQRDWFGNRYPLAQGGNVYDSEPTVIAFDPTDDATVVVGTKHVGVLASADGGISWGRVPVPANVQDVTGIVFTGLPGRFAFSSYGRSVMEVQLGATHLRVTQSGSRRSGESATWSALLSDQNRSPIAGQRIDFELVDGSGTVTQSAMAATAANGTAQASVVLPAVAGEYTLRARYTIDETIDTNLRLGAETEQGLTILR